MIGRRKRQPRIPRSPRIERQKQSIFQYSSNRSQTDRTKRSEGEEGEDTQTGLNSLKRYLYRLGLLIILAGAVATSFLTAAPRVTLADSSQQFRDVQTYQEVSRQAAGGWQSYSKLTVNREKITQELQSKYPEIVRADVSTPLFGRAAVVKVELARPAVILNAANGKFVLDQRGIALFDLDRVEPGFKTESLAEISDRTEAPVELGKPALTSGQITFITEVKRQSEAKQMPVGSIVLTGGGGELHVKHGDLPYIVKYNVYEDGRKSFGTFIATKEHADRSGLKPAEYIDVRIPERAYIK